MTHLFNRVRSDQQSKTEMSTNQFVMKQSRFYLNIIVNNVLPVISMTVEKLQETANIASFCPRIFHWHDVGDYIEYT